MHWVHGMYHWVLKWADSPYALPAIFLLAFAESSFFPIPPDVLLIAMAVGRPKRSFHFAALCTLGSVLGGMFGYAIGLGLWSSVDQLFYSYVPGFSPEAFARVQGLYEEWGITIVFTAGFSPIPYKIFTIASGVLSMSFLPFILASVISRGARFFLVGALIYRFGGTIQKFIDRYFNILALVFCLLFVGGVLAAKVLF
ncbi:MAG: cytochrome B [Myxococcales bacterium]|nr:cytochrome B [Myxococcales bacterium]